MESIRLGLPFCLKRPCGQPSQQWILQLQKFYTTVLAWSNSQGEKSSRNGSERGSVTDMYKSRYHWFLPHRSIIRTTSVWRNRLQTFKYLKLFIVYSCSRLRILSAELFLWAWAKLSISLSGWKYFKFRLFLFFLFRNVLIIAWKGIQLTQNSKSLFDLWSIARRFANGRRAISELQLILNSYVNHFVAYIVLFPKFIGDSDECKFPFNAAVSKVIL